MFNTISWQQYMTVVFLLTAAWYLYVGLRYYRPEISVLLKNKTTKLSALPPVAGAHEVPGAVRTDPGTGSAEPDELIFSHSSADDISEATLPKGPSDELLAEAELLIAAFADSSDKPGFLSLLRILISKYEIVKEEISLPDLINALKTSAHQLPFEIEAGEWPLTFTS